MSTKAQMSNVFLAERRYFLNPSNTKYISICLAHEFKFQPSIVISGYKHDCVLFSQTEWVNFLSHKSVIDSFMGGLYQPTIRDKTFQLEFMQLPCMSALKIIKGETHIILGANSIASIWAMLPLINYHLETLKKEEFTNTLEILKLGVDFENPIESGLKIMEPIKNINKTTYGIALELLYRYSGLFNGQL
uniref:Uncharacterized protein LOC114339247 n=1 Tax=Diabrotica virgifera virgifera TaxID=50390 RepID=A0A6P7GPH0_DIAVI